MEAVDTKTDPELLIGPKYDNLFIPRPVMELRKEAPMKPRLLGCAKSEGLVFACKFYHIISMLSVNNFLIKLKKTEL